MDILRHAIAHVAGGQDLTEDEAYWVMTAIMNGEATPAQIGGYLVGLAAKGEGVAEIAGSARAMREHAVPVHHHADGKLVDTCGTGGDYGGTFNISTTAAFVVAGCGVPVAKHGNRSITSKSGSADVLKALGVNLDLTPDQVGRCIDEVGIGFLYAVHHHPAMKHAAGPRRELGLRTIFNILGPLSNPAGATHQIIGVFNPALTEPMAEVLGRLGGRAALVFHGADGLDELSTTGVNRVSHLLHGRVRSFDFDAADIGLRRAHLTDLLGGVAEENAAVTRAILSGEERGPKRAIVLLNAAAALAVENLDWIAALEQAQHSLDSGAALARLEALVAHSQGFA
ncbi:MAG: anthranilate phosphoribosyltransferase [Caldilineales bacterium]|nr:anthranilate phosphoribosyltransferase [Caldilineales bacterium]MCW5860883.1 anthranilate phosphoribosyltransferase [Caldilineales bacterium]